MLTPARAVLALIVVATAVRLVLAGIAGLGYDESYSVANARVLSLSYVDHPPLHLWLAGLSARLFGSDHALAVRLPFILLFAGTTWLMFRLTALLFGERAGMWAAILVNLAPQISLAAGSWVLPDGPLDFFLLAGALVAARILFAGPQPSRAIGPWLAFGALGGLAMLSKYHGVFLFAGVGLFLLIWRPARGLLLTPGPWLAGIAGLVVFSPVIIWNIQNDWVGLWFHTRRVGHASEFNALRILESLGGQAAFLTPWLMLPLAYVWGKGLAAGLRKPRDFLLALLASGPILVFTLSNIFRRGLPHWPMPGWLLVFPLLGQATARWEEAQPRLMRRLIALSAAFFLGVLALLTLQTATGGFSRLSPAFARIDPTLDLLDWHEAGVLLKERGLMGADVAALAGPHWMDAGKMNYAVGREKPVLCVCDNPQHFRFLRDAGAFRGGTVVIVARTALLERLKPMLQSRFATLEPLPPIVLRRGGMPAMELAVWRGAGFIP